MRKSLRFAASFLCVVLLICGCFGAFLYLGRYRVQEPLLELDYQGSRLLLTLSQESYILPLTIPERIAQWVQQYWIFLPREFRLTAQIITWLFQQ